MADREGLYSNLPEEEQQALYASRLDLVLGIVTSPTGDIELVSRLGDRIPQKKRLENGRAIVSLFNDGLLRGRFTDLDKLKLTSVGEKDALGIAISQAESYQ